MPDTAWRHPLRAPDAVAIFAALGEPFRLAIIERLCIEGPLSTVLLGDRWNGVSRQGLTKHLQVLEEAGLVDSARRGGIATGKSGPIDWLWPAPISMRPRSSGMYASNI
jgi:DNA-binding transcriptional ArsR family regulator